MAFLIALSALAGLGLAVAYCLYYAAFHSPQPGQNLPFRLPAGEQYEALRPQMLESIQSLAQRSYERVEILSHDRLRLVGRYYNIRPGAPVAICFHGYRGLGVRDFCMGSELCFQLGQNLLLVDQRAQGESAGHSMSFGVNERRDCLDWIDYVNARFGENTPILLYGVSMGASTVLLSTGFPLPVNVMGVIADSPFDSPEGIIKRVCRDRGYPATLLWPFIRLGAALFGGFSVKGCSVPEAVSRATVPILLIHGQDDRFVPWQMSQHISEAKPELVRLCVFPGAGHGLSLPVDPARYRREVGDFLSGLGLPRN